MTNSTDTEVSEISLTEIDEQRQASEERTRDGQSGSVLYQLKYHKEDPETTRGKSTEIGRIGHSDRMDLEAIDNDQYTHYGIFRLEDRSTVTIVQDVSEDLYKIFSLGRNTVKIVCPVTITET